MQSYTQNNRMRRPVIILLSLLLLSASMFAESGLPIIEVKADRTMIYPQRMDLTGEETLMDILQMVPDLMIAMRMSSRTTTSASTTVR